MITDAFDPQSAAKINVPANENAVKVDAVIYTFSRIIEQYVLDNYECEKVGEMHNAGCSTPVYCFPCHGHRFGFFKTWVGAPACVGTVEEVMGILNARKFIHFGGAGCLDKEIARGKVMVPTAAYRDEGTSYHYAPAWITSP